MIAQSHVAATSARPMTMTEKALARASGRESVRPGDLVVVRVDRAVLTETQFAPNSINWREPRHIANPESIAIVADHAVPAPTVRDAAAIKYAREFSERFDLRFFDVGGSGISHELVAENRLARPGEVLLCADSHTCASGAFNCAARGVGGLEMVSVVCTGETWFVVAPSVLVTLTGELPPHCDGKDAFLAIAQEYGSADNRNLEFAGPGVTGMSLHHRRTVATQCMEIQAGFVMFPCDDVIRDHFSDLVNPVHADPEAEYDEQWRVDLSQVVPKVATPGGVVGNVTDVTKVAGLQLDQCFIGSCANGHLEDFRLAAETLRGRKVAKGTRLIVTPASQQIHAEASRAGYVADIIEAGGIVTNSTCGACYGYHMGVLADGERCLTASTRNFKGRMGSAEAEVYLASARTVAASAVAGEIIDPRELTNED